MEVEVKTPAEASETTEAPAPKFLTVEDFNKAASARDKRFEAKLEKTLAAFAERMTPKTPEVTEETPAEAAAPGTPAQKQDPTAVELAKLRRKLETAEKEREAEKAARQEQAAKAARDEERNTLVAALSGEGITGVKARAVMALLHGEDRRVTRDDGGKIVFVNSDNEQEDFATGLKAWLASDEGKHFSPPRQVQGTGATPGKPPIRKPADARAKARAALGDALMRGMV